MSKVIRLGYVHLRVTDLEEARNHYSNTLGMEVVASEPGKLYLSAGTSGTTTRWCSKRAGSGWSSSATRSKARTP
jgi:catechol-2,3-dioxygenase